MSDISKVKLHDGLYNIKDNTARELIDTKQDELVSGENIKTINGQSILGNGNIDISEKPYASLRRLGDYVYEATFNNIPEENNDILSLYNTKSFGEVGSCSSFVKDGKLYRHLDWNYNNDISFHIICPGFEGMSFITGLSEGNINDELIGQLPYHIVDGKNKYGIMVSIHVLFNDWDAVGSGEIPLTKIPYIVLNNVKSIATISEDLGDTLSNLSFTGENPYLMQMLVSDGVNTCILSPKKQSNLEYEIIDATNVPKLANFRWYESETVARTDSEMQDRGTGVERWNMMPCELPELRFSKCYEEPSRLSEFIGENGTTKYSTDAELMEVYNSEHAIYLERTRDGQTWQTMHSVVYGPNGMEHLWVQENWDKDYVSQSDSGVWEQGSGSKSVQQKDTLSLAQGDYSVAEGYNTLAISDYSHTEGWATRTIIDPTDTESHGHASHAEGSHTIAKGAASHAEGNSTESNGWYSHAEGAGSLSGGVASHAEGSGTVTNNLGEHAEGTYNKSTLATSPNAKDGTLHSIGIGTSMFDAKNAFEVMQNGDAYLLGLGNYDGTNYSEAESVQEVITNKQDTLNSGVNIKTINGESILGSGNIEISGGESVQSDYEQKDEEAKDYIKNRPFYDNREEVHEIVSYDINIENPIPGAPMPNMYECIVEEYPKPDEEFSVTIVIDGQSVIIPSSEMELEETIPGFADGYSYFNEETGVAFNIIRCYNSDGINYIYNMWHITPSSDKAAIIFMYMGQKETTITKNLSECDIVAAGVYIYIVSPETPCTKDTAWNINGVANDEEFYVDSDMPPAYESEADTSWSVTVSESLTISVMILWSQEKAEAYSQMFGKEIKVGDILAGVVPTDENVPEGTISCSITEVVPPTSAVYSHEGTILVGDFKQIDRKFIETDWNQNDETKSGYIANKPFYDSREEVSDTYTPIQEIGNPKGLDTVYVYGITLPNYPKPDDTFTFTIRVDGEMDEVFTQDDFTPYNNYRQIKVYSRLLERWNSILLAYNQNGKNEIVDYTGVPFRSDSDQIFIRTEKSNLSGTVEYTYTTTDESGESVSDTVIMSLENPLAASTIFIYEVELPEFLKYGDDYKITISLQDQPDYIIDKNTQRVMEAYMPPDVSMFMFGDMLGCFLINSAQGLLDFQYMMEFTSTTDKVGFIVECYPADLSVVTGITVECKTVTGELKKIERKFVNTDWNNNDPEDSGYIENKPFYEVDNRITNTKQGTEHIYDDDEDYNYVYDLKVDNRIPIKDEEWKIEISVPMMGGVFNTVTNSSETEDYYPEGFSKDDYVYWFASGLEGTELAVAIPYSAKGAEFLSEELLETHIDVSVGSIIVMSNGIPGNYIGEIKYTVGSITIKTIEHKFLPESLQFYDTREEVKKEQTAQDYVYADEDGTFYKLNPDDSSFSADSKWTVEITGDASDTITQDNSEDEFETGINQYYHLTSNCSVLQVVSDIGVMVMSELTGGEISCKVGDMFLYLAADTTEMDLNILFNSMSGELKTIETKYLPEHLQFGEILAEKHIERDFRDIDNRRLYNLSKNGEIYYFENTPFDITFELSYQGESTVYTINQDSMHMPINGVMEFVDSTRELILLSPLSEDGITFLREEMGFELDNLEIGSMILWAQFSLDDYDSGTIIANGIGKSIKPIDKKFLPDDIGGVQSDYNQNDETASDYIKNRPFYDTRVEPVTLTQKFSDGETHEGNYKAFYEFELPRYLNNNDDFSFTFAADGQDTVVLNKSDFYSWSDEYYKYSGSPYNAEIYVFKNDAGLEEKELSCGYRSSYGTKILIISDIRPSTSGDITLNYTIDGVTKTIVQPFNSPRRYLPKKAVIWPFECERMDQENINISSFVNVFSEKIDLIKNKQHSDYYEDLTIYGRTESTKYIGLILIHSDTGKESAERFIRANYDWDYSIPDNVNAFVILDYYNFYDNVTDNDSVEFTDLTPIGELKKIDKKFLPDDIGGVQSDYNQNDNQADDYIKNRPFYEIEGVYINRDYNDKDSLVSNIIGFNLSRDGNYYIPDKTLFKLKYDLMLEGEEYKETIVQSNLEEEIEEMGCLGYATLDGFFFVLIPMNDLGVQCIKELSGDALNVEIGSIVIITNNIFEGGNFECSIFPITVDNRDINDYDKKQSRECIYDLTKKLGSLDEDDYFKVEFEIIAEGEKFSFKIESTDDEYSTIDGLKTWRDSQLGGYVYKIIDETGIGTIRQAFGIESVVGDVILVVYDYTAYQGNISFIKTGNIKKSLDIKYLPEQLQIGEYITPSSFIVDYANPDATDSSNHKYYNLDKDGKAYYSENHGFTISYSVVYNGRTYTGIVKSSDDYLDNTGLRLWEDSNIILTIYAAIDETGATALREILGVENIRVGSIVAVLSSGFESGRIFCNSYENIFKKISKEYLPDDVGVQSDYEQKNSQAIDYIKNRPFYEVAKGTRGIIDYNFDLDNPVEDEPDSLEFIVHTDEYQQQKDEFSITINSNGSTEIIPFNKMVHGPVDDDDLWDVHGGYAFNNTISYRITRFYSLEGVQEYNNWYSADLPEDTTAIFEWIPVEAVSVRKNADQYDRSANNTYYYKFSQALECTGNRYWQTEASIGGRGYRNYSYDEPSYVSEDLKEWTGYQSKTKVQIPLTDKGALELSEESGVSIAKGELLLSVIPGESYRAAMFFKIYEGKPSFDSIKYSAEMLSTDGYIKKLDKKYLPDDLVATTAEYEDAISVFND